MHTKVSLMPSDLTASSSDAAALLRALSNEGRLLILCHLIVAGELSVGALVERIGLSQSALSQHLAKLRDERIVDVRREAQTRFYRVSDPRAEQVLGVLRNIFCPDLGPDPGAATASVQSLMDSAALAPEDHPKGE